MIPRIWDPFAEMEEMMRNLPTLSNNQAAVQKGFVPALDVYETKQDVVVETPLPGIDPKDVEVSVEKGVLTIQGQSKKEHEMQEKNYYRKEIRTGSFFRQVALPGPVKEDKINAEFSDGILKISCPKAMPSAAKKVSIKVLKKNNGEGKLLKK